MTGLMEKTVLQCRQESNVPLNVGISLATSRLGPSFSRRRPGQNLGSCEGTGASG